MFLVLRALRRPVTVVVLALAILLSGGLALRNAPVDIFPSLGVPVIYVVQPYAGMSPLQMESQLVTYYEYHFLYVLGIEHIESSSIQGMAMLKLYFHPGTDIAQAMAQVTAMTFRSTAFMPPGTLPAFIVRFDAGSIPVGQLVFSSSRRSDQEIQDLVLYRVRPVLATLPGVSAPPPSGGKVRTIVAYADPDRMRSYRVSPDELARALARENLTLPAGNVRMRGLTTIAATNAMVIKPSDLESVPIRVGAGPTIYVRDVARIADSADVVYNIALVNGRRTVYMPITKRPDASTLAVVRGLKAALPRMRDLLPEDVHVDLEFDQSVYVTNSTRGLVTEAAIGAVLTSLMVLLFLRDIWSALIVVVTIPLSLLTAVVGLRLAGETINIMTLGGLALAVGILVDESTVAIENIHAHLARGKPAARAVVDAMGEVVLPRLLAMLCVLSVFIPTFFMVGVGKALFPPLALAVGFSMIASFFLSSALVPVLSVWLLRRRSRPRSHGGFFSRLQAAYTRLVRVGVRHCGLFAALYVLVCVGLGTLLPWPGTELFPQVDAGQFQLRIRAPAGTQLERTEDIVRGVEKLIRRTVGDGLVKTTLANIGNPAWSYPVNGVYVWNAGPHEAVLLVALKPGEGRPGMNALKDRLRTELSTKWPQVRFSFEAGDIVSQVMNFGAPTPINVTVAGNDLAATRAHADRILGELSRISLLRDVQIPQALDYPTIEVNIDRERAGQLGVTVEMVGRSIVAATSSSQLTTPNFWTNPQTGIPYRVQVRVPENQLASLEDVRNLPVMPSGAARPLVADVATVEQGSTLGEVDHLNSQRVVSVVANVGGRDLGAAARAVAHAVRSVGQPPRGSKVEVHGQVEQMANTLQSLRAGLLLAIVVVLLLLAANFQSLRAALLVLSVVPAVLVGVLVALLVTNATLNVQSMMGAIMSIGVAVANAVLLVTFARQRRMVGDDPASAALTAARERLRPILMTSLAMIVGMVPMALGLGEGGDQSAPLGRAIIGGLAASMFASLLVLPALYALGERKGPWRSASLDPDDPTSPEHGEAASP